MRNAKAGSMDTTAMIRRNGAHLSAIKQEMTTLRTAHRCGSSQVELLKGPITIYSEAT